VYPNDIGYIYLSAYYYIYILADSYINPKVLQYTLELIYLIAVKDWAQMPYWDLL
jgi:hypothetical protein